MCILFLHHDLLSDQITAPSGPFAIVLARAVARSRARARGQVSLSFRHIFERFAELVGRYTLDFVKDSLGDLEDWSSET